MPQNVDAKDVENTILTYYNPNDSYAWKVTKRFTVQDGALPIAYRMFKSTVLPGETELRQDFLDVLRGMKRTRSQLKDMLKNKRLDTRHRELYERQLKEREDLDNALKGTDPVRLTFVYHERPRPTIVVSRPSSPTIVVSSPALSPPSPPSPVKPFMTMLMTMLIDALSDAGQSIERVYVIIIRTVGILLGLCILFALIALGIVIRRRMTETHTKGRHVRKKKKG